MHLKTLLSWPLSAANLAKSFISATPEAVKDPNNSLEHNSTFSSLSICVFLKNKQPPPEKKKKQKNKARLQKG